MDTDTFLTTLYVIADDFCKTQSMPCRPGPEASLSMSEVITLSVFGQWAKFQSERDFYRYASIRLRSAFPGLPVRSQFNRLVRYYGETIERFCLHMADILNARECLYESLDTYGAVTRNSKRRGRGWLPGLAEIGWCNRVGWYEGFRVMTSVNPGGIITGFGFAQGSAKEQPMTETFLALRNQAEPEIVSVGHPALGYYVADKGFEGEDLHRQWRDRYGADVITAPRRDSRNPWPKALRRWLAGLRQIVETVFEKLHNTFGLSHERPHDLTGFQARLAAKMALPLNQVQGLYMDKPTARQTEAGFCRSDRLVSYFNNSHQTL